MAWLGFVSLNQIVARYPEGSIVRNTLLQEYLQSTRFAREAISKDEIARFERIVDSFRKYGDRSDPDYLLMMTRGYQKSRSTGRQRVR